jgi:hypothetical protein
MNDPFQSRWHVRRAVVTVSPDRDVLRHIGAVERLWSRDQIRRTRGVVVGGAVPGGLAYCGSDAASNGAVNVTVTRFATKGIDVTLAFVFSAAARDAFWIAGSCLLQSCSETPRI